MQKSCLKCDAKCATLSLSKCMPEKSGKWLVFSDKHLLVGQVIALERGCASHELPIGDACLKRGMQRVYAKCVPENAVHF